MAIEKQSKSADQKVVSSKRHSEIVGYRKGKSKISTPWSALISCYSA